MAVSTKIATVKVQIKGSESGYIVINKSDFDKKKDKLFIEKEKSKKELADETKKDVEDLFSDAFKSALKKMNKAKLSVIAEDELKLDLSKIEKNADEPTNDEIRAAIEAEIDKQKGA